MYYEKINSKGIDLYKPFDDSDQWVLDLKDGEAFYGTFKQIGFYMCDKLGFFVEDIDLAVHTMIESDHNAVHFGIYKSFIYSFNKPVFLDKKAG